MHYSHTFSSDWINKRQLVGFPPYRIDDKVNQAELDVSLTCIAIFLQQLVTIVQQLIAIARWPEIQKEVLAWDLYIQKNPHASTVFVPNPDKWLTITLQISMYIYCISWPEITTNKPLGLYFFNVESLLFFFWWVEWYKFDFEYACKGPLIHGTGAFCYSLLFGKFVGPGSAIQNSLQYPNTSFSSFPAWYQ